MNKKYNKFSAFTLMEVIVTIIIIGVIAIVVVNSIKNKSYNEEALKAKSFKVLKDIDYATRMILANDSNDGTMYNLIATDGSTLSIQGNSHLTDLEHHTKLADLYKKYLVTTKKECNDNTCQCYKASGDTLKQWAAYFYLKNGACLLIYNYGSLVTIFPGETELKQASNFDAYMVLDINNTEKPNTVGIDKFIIPIGKKGIVWNAE